LFAEKSFAICEEYIAGWFSHFPAAHLTPYAGIQAVPPSSFVTLRAGQHAVRTHWDFDPENRIRYRTDGEYEEHFRAVFASAVRRRLRADRPVLAELSGGVDSSCIVCIADALIACTGAEGVRLDTISYYDDNEPNWGEKGNFVKVEEMRGRAGCHIAVNLEKDIASDAPVGSHFGSDHFVAIPIATPRHRELLTRYAAHMKSEGHRVVLSGIGAEVPTGGGVPTPTPELQDLLSQGRFLTLARQLNGWARKMRRSRALLLWEAIRGFVPGIDSTGIRSAPWLHADFVRRNHRALCGYPRRVQILGARPSFQDHLTGLDFLRRLVAYRSLRPQLPSDVRLPFLDLDFLKFMYAIPREQIVRMGERRSLMKRALSGIVPPEVLNRKKRAFVQEASSRNTSSDRPCFVGMDNHPLLSSCIGMIDANRLREALRRAGNDQEVSLERLERTLTFEFWLRHLAIHNVALDLASVGKPNHGSSRKPTYLRSDAVSKRSAS
jgi:asparagine synthase (glutamine-hydrolysing)